MALIKHSERTVRKPCNGCGSLELYWGHDTDRPEGSITCSKCKTPDGQAVKGKFVLINRDGSAHNCPGRNKPAGSDGAASPASPAPSPASPAPEPNGSGVIHGIPGQDKLAVAAQLLEALSPKVDADQVRRMIAEQHDEHALALLAKVDAKISEITAPVTVKVETEHEVRELPGLTHKSVPAVLTMLNAGEHVLMVGPAGTGKSTIAEQCAEALFPDRAQEDRYYAISLSPQTPASSLLGYMQAAGEYVSSLFRKAYEHGGVFHFDEFDNAHPSVLAVINASLANGEMGFPDRMVRRHPDFKVCASANTYGRGPDRQYVGRQALDAATLDRFSIITIDVDEALEREICRATGASDAVVSEVLRFVRGLRGNAQAHRMALIFSPRASVGMCRLIKAGMSVSDAIESRARRGISDADWRKVSGDVSLPNIRS